MSKHNSIFLIALTLFTAVAQAETFSNVKGTYQITSCQNLGAKPSEDICQYETIVIRPDQYATAIYFYSGPWGSDLVRSFGFPASIKDDSGKYEEIGNSYASYTNLGTDYKEATSIKLVQDNKFHLSRYQSSQSFQTEDKFELSLIKISNETPELPIIPDPEDPD